MKIEDIMNASCREMTYEELKENHRKINVENEDLKITNEILLKNIKSLRVEIENFKYTISELKQQLNSNKEKKLEEKKERLFKND